MSNMMDILEKAIEEVKISDRNRQLRIETLERDIERERQKARAIEEELERERQHAKDLRLLMARYRTHCSQLTDEIKLVNKEREELLVAMMALIEELRADQI